MTKGTSQGRQAHYAALERMYLSAPINEFYWPTIKVSRELAEISMEVVPAFFHPAGAIHGSVTWKMLDDAAFFAAASIEEDVFIVTTSFTTYLTRPVSEGIIRSVGHVVNATRSQIIAESVAYDSNEQEVARGNGIFVRGKVRLDSIETYRLEDS